MTGAQLRKLMARQGVGAAPAAWSGDVRSLLREVRASRIPRSASPSRTSGPAIAARGFTWTGYFAAQRHAVITPSSRRRNFAGVGPCYLASMRGGADNSHARGCKKYIRSMASLVGLPREMLGARARRRRLRSASRATRRATTRLRSPTTRRRRPSRLRSGRGGDRAGAREAARFRRRARPRPVRRPAATSKLRRCARSDVRITATRRADVGELKGHLDYYYHLAGHPPQLRSRRAVASALGLSGDW